MPEWKPYVQLNNGQSWSLSDGTKLHGIQAYEYLLKLTGDQKKLYQNAVLLKKDIQSVLNSYHLSRNIIIDAVNLDKLLSNIDLFCEMYRKVYESHCRY